MAKKTVKKDEYIVTAKILGKNYIAKGVSVKEALEKLDVGISRGRAILTVTHGKVVKERVLSVIQATRLFNTRGMSRDVTLKNISLLFEGI